MIALKDVQQHAADRIKTAPLWSGPTAVVLADDGKTQAAEDAAFRDVGFYAVVLFPFNGRLMAGAASMAVLDSIVVVEFVVNPAKAPKSILEYIQDAVSGVLAYAPQNPNDRYKLDDSGDCLVIDDSPGRIAAYLFLKKKCSLS